MPASPCHEPASRRVLSAAGLNPQNLVSLYAGELLKAGLRFRLHLSVQSASDIPDTGSGQDATNVLFSRYPAAVEDNDWGCVS